MVIPAILQPAFLKDIINVSLDFFGSINGLLQNMSQIATLLFVGYVGMLSDRVGRKILAIIGFLVLAVFFYLFLFSNQIAAALHLPAGLSASICAALSFAPSRAAEFSEFGQGLFVAYVIRLIIGIGLVLVYPQFITMVADYVAEKDRGKGMALNGMMMGLGSLLIFGLVAPIGKKCRSCSCVLYHRGNCSGRCFLYCHRIEGSCAGKESGKERHDGNSQGSQQEASP